MIRRIKSCPNSDYILQSDDICVRKRNCFKNKFLYDSLVYVRKIHSCPCEKELCFECGPYCAEHNEACDTLSFGKLSATKHINNCQ